MCLRTLALCCLIQVSVCTASETVVFKKRPSQPGDSSQQTIQCDLDLKMSIRQAGQVVQAQEQGIQRKQLRELTILSVGESAPTKARVAYRKSSVALRTTDQPAQLADQPVTGKTYLVIRDGDRLTVTYADGEPPSDEELAIVMQNMESFGLPNPIANFFGQRTMKVNETIKLPSKVARELLGFPDTVRNITDFGAFIEVEEGIDGLIHISDMSWTKKINHPQDVLEKGQEVEVIVLAVDAENRKINLGLKQLQDNPWAQIAEKYPVNMEMEAEVVLNSNFGVFVKLEDDVEALVYSSEIDKDRATALKPGDKINVKIIKVDVEQMKIGVSARP